MEKEKIGLTFSRILLQGITICLLGGIIFWLTELFIILIKLLYKLNYICVHDGNSIMDKICLILMPEKLSTAFLIYTLISFFVGFY